LGRDLRRCTARDRFFLLVFAIGYVPSPERRQSDAISVMPGGRFTAPSATLRGLIAAAYDILAQVGALVRTGTPIGGVSVRKMMLAGTSQTAGIPKPQILHGDTSDTVHCPSIARRTIC